MLVNVDSRDRLPGGTKDSFSVNLAPPVRGRRITLVEAIIPATWYTFKAGNQTIPFQENVGGATSVQITPGNYTPAALATHIAGLLTTYSPNGRTYAGTYVASTDTMTFTPSAGTFAFLWATSSDRVWENLGYTSSSTSQAASQSNPNALSMCTDYVLVFIQPYTTLNQSSSATEGGFNAKIQITGNSGDIVFYNEGMYEQSWDHGGSGLTKLTVTITDKMGISLAMRSDWSFTLRVCDE